MLQTSLHAGIGAHCNRTHVRSSIVYDLGRFGPKLCCMAGSLLMCCGALLVALSQLYSM
jgi:hypothetical protein